ncbi:hypothetical protein, partial [Domibacillus enclensis]|uniref:hypothetical protein n=1 Tax=Domibacillus enclensis TaxID=1017273 RepID=UPI0005F79B33
MNSYDLVTESLDSSFFWKSTHRGSGLPAPLFYVANAEPAQSAWLFQPVRSSHGSLRPPLRTRSPAEAALSMLAQARFTIMKIKKASRTPSFGLLFYSKPSVP